MCFFCSDIMASLSMTKLVMELSYFICYEQFQFSYFELFWPKNKLEKYIFYCKNVRVRKCMKYLSIN